MKDEIERTTVPRRFRYWCTRCQDGYQGGKPTVIKWRDRHIADRHPEEVPNGKDDPKA